MLVEFHIGGNIKPAKKIEGDCMCSVARKRDRGIGQDRLMQPLRLSDMIWQHMNFLKEPFFKPFRCKRVFYALLLMKKNYEEADMNKMQIAK